MHQNWLWTTGKWERSTARNSRVHHSISEARRNIFWTSELMKQKHPHPHRIYTCDWVNDWVDHYDFFSWVNRNHNSPCRNGYRTYFRIISATSMYIIIVTAITQMDPLNRISIEGDCSSGSSCRVRRGARNMNSMRLPAVAIYYMTYFCRAGEAGGGIAPSAPGSATELANVVI